MADNVAIVKGVYEALAKWDINAVLGNHVQHILTKLDLSNRSQIAVWVTSRS